MTRTPNRRRRARRQEIAQQLAQEMNAVAHDYCHEQQIVPMPLCSGQSYASKPPLASDQLTGCTSECWRASSGVYETTCELFMTNDLVITCPIMHEPTCSAVIDDLPAMWPLPNNAGANTARLPCSHTFYVHALALHFLATDMRCPVCRAGSAVPMDILSMAPVDDYVTTNISLTKSQSLGA